MGWVGRQPRGKRRDLRIVEVAGDILQAVDAGARVPSIAVLRSHCARPQAMRLLYVTAQESLADGAAAEHRRPSDGGVGRLDGIRIRSETWIVACDDAVYRRGPTAIVVPGSGLADPGIEATRTAAAERTVADARIVLHPVADRIMPALTGIVECRGSNTAVGQILTLLTSRLVFVHTAPRPSSSDICSEPDRIFLKKWSMYAPGVVTTPSAKTARENVIHEDPESMYCSSSGPRVVAV